MFGKVFTALFVIFLAAIHAAGQMRPLLTEDVDITPPGRIEIAAGTDFFQNARFPLSGLRGDLTRVGDIRIRTGYAGNVEVQIEGVIQNFLAIERQALNPPIPLNISPNSTNDVGDIKTTVKIKLKNESRSLPAVGMSLGFLIPNSDQAKGIGTNQIDLYSKLILQKSFGGTQNDPRLKVYGNIGIGILSAPLDDFTQNDVLLYGIAGVYRLNKNVNFASEINGRANTRSGAAPLGTESQSQFRIGTQVKASGLRFDMAAIFGLTNTSPDTGITFGVTYLSPRIFTPAQ
ncbi:MAG: hypothetical protein OEM82_03095 [Acidobacteriota bacterium]|nr:hypothetical protein [Acidobacteriota bacterium]MDH3529860.1 hypothetical protein [Acidobacteriota bacterium]